MATVQVLDILSKVYGVRGLPFPKSPEQTTLSVNEFKASNVGADADAAIDKMVRGETGSRLWRKNVLGQWVFLPATLNGIELPNCLINISGEKEIIETNLVDVGTVFEKVFTKPYEITIICTLLNDEGTWPETELKQMYELWMKDEALTLECALTDIYLQPTKNFILKRKDLLSGEGEETVEVIQFSGRSNIDFELEIVN